MVVPTVGAVSDAPTAGWSDAATVVPWTLFERYGDREVLRRQFDSMRTWVDVVAHIAGENRLWDSGYQFGDWLDPAAPAERPDQARTAPEVVATAYFARSARIVADAAAVLGLDDEEARYGTLADDVRDAFRREYGTGAGRIVSDAPTAYALALQFDLLGAEERPLAADRLATLVRESGYRIATGFLGTPVILDAL